MTIGYLWFSIGHLRFPWVAKGTPGAPPKSRPPCAARGHLCGILYQLGWPTSGYPRSPMVTYGPTPGPTPCFLRIPEVAFGTLTMAVLITMAVLTCQL